VPKTGFCNIGDEVRRGLAPRNLTDDGLLSADFVAKVFASFGEE
jgi:hypothetical protein